MRKFYLLITFIAITGTLAAQNIGIGTPVPVARLHLKASDNSSQLVIDANSTQNNWNPLIRLRDSDDNDLLWLHSDDPTNVFLGKDAGISNDINTGGINNCFIGKGVGYANINGAYNIAVGPVALFNNVNGNYNTVLGYAALTTTTNSSYNTALGYSTLFYNTSGFYNTAIGYRTLRNNTLGNFNTACGFNTLLNNSTGTDNTAFGGEVMSMNTGGSQNAGFGSYSLSNLISGNDNTAIGFANSYYLASGSFNTGLGEIGMSNLVSGSGNTAIGGEADVNLSNIDNSTTIGYLAIGNASNKVTIGNTSVTVIGGYTGWSNLSDSRFKKNIKADVAGLDFLMQLKPVTYTMDVHKLNELLRLTRDPEKLKSRFGIVRTEKEKVFMEESIQKKEQIVYSGFEAQEVEKAAATIGYNFSGVIKPQNEKDHYSIVYSDFIPSLVKAIQEQQQMIDDLKKENAFLEEQLKKVLELISKK